MSIATHPMIGHDLPYQPMSGNWQGLAKIAAKRHCQEQQCEAARRHPLSLVDEIKIYFINNTRYFNTRRNYVNKINMALLVRYFGRRCQFFSALQTIFHPHSLHAVRPFASHLLSILFSFTVACCWLVIVCSVVNWWSSKARVYFISLFYCLTLELSPQTMVPCPDSNQRQRSHCQRRHSARVTVMLTKASNGLSPRQFAGSVLSLHNLIPALRCS
jgi:hypothetical protein